MSTELAMGSIVQQQTIFTSYLQLTACLWMPPQPTSMLHSVANPQAAMDETNFFKRQKKTYRLQNLSDEEGHHILFENCAASDILLIGISRACAGRRLFINDVITDEDGHAYATDSYNDHIIRVTSGGEASRFASSPDWLGKSGELRFR